MLYPRMSVVPLCYTYACLQKPVWTVVRQHLIQAFSLWVSKQRYGILKRKISVNRWLENQGRFSSAEARTGKRQVS